MALQAAIIGGTGYGGAEILRRLLRHPEVDVRRVTAADNIGKPVGEVHQNLYGRTSLVFEEMPAKDAVRGCDVVFLALPHKTSAKVAMELFDTGVKIIDLSGDFRLSSADAYERDYGAKHPAPHELGTFVYGLPELNREALRTASRVASPGCFATTITLGVLPLARAGLLRGTVHTVGITGSSGSGAAPSLGVHHALRANNLRTYKPLAHQHRPEIVETLTKAGASDLGLEFVPVSAPLPRGIFATTFVTVSEAFSAADAAALWSKAFANEPFIKVVLGRYPEVVGIVGTNYVEVGYELGPVRGGARTLACFSALDNLVKGGAGQAVQSMNVMFGLGEATSLDDPRPMAVSIVVKVGGEVVADESLRANLARGVRALHDDGERVFVIHGGGPQATTLSLRLGLRPHIVGGRRVTDAETLLVMMRVAGEVNVTLTAALTAVGVRALGLSGSSAGLVRARRRPPVVITGGGSEPIDLGFVGDVVSVNVALLETLSDDGYVPVLSSLGGDDAGAVYNINADVVAGEVAEALGAERLLHLTGAPGVLADLNDPGSRFATLTAHDARAAITSGRIKGGMIPKVEESLLRLRGRIGAIHIVGAATPNGIAAEVHTPGSVGTVFVRD